MTTREPTMTITDLISALEDVRSTYGDMTVLVDGYEDGYQIPEEIELASVVDLRVPGEPWKCWWSGYFEKVDEYYDGVSRSPMRAVVIHR